MHFVLVNNCRKVQYWFGNKGHCFCHSLVLFELWRFGVQFFFLAEVNTEQTLLSKFGTRVQLIQISYLGTYSYTPLVVKQYCNVLVVFRPPCA